VLWRIEKIARFFCKQKDENTMRKKKVLLRDDDVADDLLETENLVVDLGQTTIIETSCGKRLSQSISEMSN